MTANRALLPYDLSWAEVDPARHPFDPAAAPAAVRGLEPAARTPARPPGPVVDPAFAAWSFDVARVWIDDLTAALVERYGRWATGWRWGTDEADVGGGPVRAWCCPADSVHTPPQTLERAAAALCEWRAWLEELAERFDRYPLDAPRARDRRHVRERAVGHLVNAVVERTGADDAWYGHCSVVLTWYLTRWGEDPGTASVRVREAIGGRFESWIGPAPGQVDDLARRLGGGDGSGGPRV
ncbi:hypothetical protein SAMN05421803_101231 [Nocardiopsis flavescens]|uniref:Uncharacterized protein n=1 Tax=Nocardiopsis flavescens TaxID=758803 RepID=A0A1M6B6H1_9ACTN|nr:hypothetical protein [Nocardiopsis flavescens]SHI44178.1 hypothetical protein SAMN05421803_101231 [Nocardiopsis flavescens]